MNTKLESREWRQEEEPRPKKAGWSCSKINTMATVFIFCFLFNIWGVVHHEYVPWGQTVKKEYYVEVLKRLQE